MAKYNEFRKHYEKLGEYEQEMIRIFVKILALDNELKAHFGKEIERAAKGGE